MPKGYTRIEPGVYRAPERNYWVRATACHPRTGRRINLSASLPIGATLRDARSRLAELRAEIETLIEDDAPTVRRKRLTLADCAASWTRVQKDRVRPGTVEHYVNLLGQHILPAPVGPQGVPFGEIFVEELSRVDVERWCRWAERVTQADGRQYAKATIDGWWRVLCAFLRDTAAEQGLADPINRVKAPRIVGRAKRREQGTLTRQELAALVRAVEPSRYAEVYLMGYSGLRPGEMFALEWRDINWEAGCIHIRRGHRRGRVDKTKTNAPRDVGLTKRLRKVLEEHQRMSLRVFEEEVGLPTALVEYLAAEKYVTNSVVRRLLGFGEMKTRLALSRSVLHDPELLLFDEPTSGLDPESSHAVLELIREMTSDGRTVVMCTHLLVEAEGLADQVIVMENGTDLLTGTQDELTSQLFASNVVRFEAEDPTSLDVLAEATGVLHFHRSDQVGDGAPTGWVAGMAEVHLDDLERVPDLVADLAAAGVRLRRVEPFTPSLEDLYFEVRRRRRAAGVETPL